MKNTLKLTYVFALALVLSIFSCNNDDEETVIPEITVEINVENLTATIDENPTNGQSIGTVQTDGSGSLSFSITSQTPAGALDINTSTGELTVADAALFDFETNPEITATISVDGAANTGVITIDLNDLDELSTQDLTVTIDENPTDGQVIGTVQADGDGTLSFIITSQTPAGALAINTSTGELTVVDPNLFDFETNSVITADILVDNSGNTQTSSVTINLNDLDEVSAQSLSVAIDENPTSGDVVGSIQATGGNLVYAITFQNPAGALEINTSTGELTVADAALFDFETNPNMLATVSVENAVNMVSVNAAISLNDVAEAATIGEFRDGGVVFWVDPTDNTHGLVLSINNLATGTEWGCDGIVIPDASGSAIGTGATNTVAIEAVCTASGTAADIAANLSLNGYDDWFLPSHHEWSEVHTNLAIINGTAVANGGVNILSLTSDRYWTSTSEGIYARAFRGNDGTSNTTLRIAGLKVRAARAF